MKKITLIMLSLGAAYTAHANEATDLATQRANLDNELQIFAKKCKEANPLLLTNREAGFVSACTSIGAMLGISCEGRSTTKFLAGLVIGWVGSLLYIAIQKNYILYLDKARLQMQRDLYEINREHEASATEGPKPCEAISCEV